MTRDTSENGTEDETMGAVDHTHPHRNTTFGSVFGRGPAIAADGGEPAAGRQSSSERSSDGGRPAADGDGDADADGDRTDDVDAEGGLIDEADGNRRDDDAETDEMIDVTHTPPHGDGANEVFERGDEGDVSTHE